MDTLLPQLPEHAGHRDRILDGSNGPLVADCAALRARPTRHGLPGPQGWVRFRRAVGEPGGEPEVKISLRTAPADTPLAEVPADTPLAEVVRVSGRRWPIASCFAEGKSEVGLAPYELRSWRGWPHPMTLVILAHHFLGRRQQRLNQRGGPRGPPAPLEPPVCLDQAAAVCAVPPTPVVLSLAQVRRRQAVRPRPVLDVAAALDLLLYQQERKAAAYRSHRKRILRQLGLLNPP